jgi:hypothetical protein
MVARWEGEPQSRTGEGPLFFGDRRRAFVELLRSHLELLPGEPGRGRAVAAIATAQAVGSLAKALGAPVPDLAAVRAALCPPGQGILVYVPGHEASVLAAIDASSLEVLVLPVGAMGLDRRRQELLRAIEAARAGPDASGLEARAAAVAAVLLPPALAGKLAGWRGVAVVGLDSLGYLPFELLPGPAGARLGISHAVSYLPSLPVGVWLQQHRPPARVAAAGTARVRIVACPDADAPPGLADRPQPLPFGREETAVLAAATADAEVQVVRGADATADAWLEAACDAAFVQLLGHGVRDEARSDPQGLLLGDGTVLWSAELERRRSPVNVLIAACRAARGRLRRGDDGRHQLTGALLLAGARSVVAPVLDVGYQASVHFSADVHTGLFREGLPIAEALRRARCAASDRGGAGELDACLFHLVGLGEVPLAAPAASASPWQARALAALLLLAAGSAFLARRRRARRVG